MSQYVLYLCNHHKYHVKSKKYRCLVVKCAVGGNRKERCILRVIAQNKNKNYLSAIAKNLNTNNPRIVLENVNAVANAKNLTTEISQRDICAINIDDNKHISINSLNNAIDFDNNAIFSFDNEYGHNAINGESNISNPTRHVDSDNVIQFSNDSDNKYSIAKTVDLNVTFPYDDSNSCKTDGDIKAKNSTNGDDFDNNVLISCDNGNDCKTVDISTHNFMNSNDSHNNVIFSCDNGNANNSVTGVVLNNIMILFCDDGNNSSILNDVTNAKTSVDYDDGDNNITFACDDDNINNITTSTTITSEYPSSASEITIEVETIKHESTRNDISINNDENSLESLLKYESTHNDISINNDENSSESLIKHESTHNDISINNDKNSSESLIDISSVNTFGCKEDNLCIPFSQPNGHGKKNFCYYCKKFQSKIARHLETVHKLEPEVTKFLLLPKGNLERKKIIETIRRKGNFIHNTDPSINTGELIVCRRPAKHRNKTVQDFTACAKCKGWFTKNNIRHHFKQCVGVSKDRSVQILGRAVMGRIHECASETVRKVLFPVLREDGVTRCIRHDKLLIIYANKLCVKYNHQHQQDLVRARLRLLGRFLIAVKEYNPNVTEFSDIYDPSIYDDCLKAVNKVADFDYINKKYGAPSAASNIGTYLKQIGNLLITECIQTNDLKKQGSTENFLKLVQTDYGISINKIVGENMTQRKRQKKVTLPSMEDIKKLHSYLSNERRLLYTKLQKKFIYESWQEFAKVTLTSVQVLNRIRAGEIERVTIEDFNSREDITKEIDLVLHKSVGTNLQQVADKYVRFLIRGKLGCTVPVILDMELVQCIELILKHRKDANVPEHNPYVFGIPSNIKHYSKYLRACNLLRHFSTKCGAQIPYVLRGTELRKHTATTRITLETIRMFLSAALREDVPQQSNNSGSDEMVQGTSKDASSEELDSDAETCMVNSYEPPSVQSGSKLPKICITDSQQKSVNRRKIAHQNRAIMNNDNDSDETYSPKMKKRRNTSPFGLTKRRRWTEVERNTIFKEFQKEITISKLPSSKKIFDVKEKNKCLVNRSVAQIKTWIHNYISGKIKCVNVY